MKYFLDTEFHEKGPGRHIELISLGILREDGRELYFENADADLDDVSPWIKKNVVPYLLGGEMAIRREVMPDRVIRFFDGEDKPEIWGYCADYDWVLFCQIFQRMTNLPSCFPGFCLDLRQELFRLGLKKPTDLPTNGVKHNAIADCRWNLELYNWIQARAAKETK